MRLFCACWIAVVLTCACASGEVEVEDVVARYDEFEEARTVVVARGCECDFSISGGTGHASVQACVAQESSFWQIGQDRQCWPQAYAADVEASLASRDCMVRVMENVVDCIEASTGNCERQIQCVVDFVSDSNTRFMGCPRLPPSVLQARDDCLEELGWVRCLLPSGPDEWREALCPP